MSIFSRFATFIIAHVVLISAALALVQTTN